MKLIAFIVLAANLQASANVFGQKITLVEKNEKIQKVFADIEKQSGFYFLINESQIKVAKPITLEVTNQDLNEVLKVCFQSQPFSYEIKENLIIVRNKDEIIKESKQETKFQEIRGKITNERGEPLQGVTIFIKGSTTGVTSNSRGEFVISSDNNSNTILVFSFIGYKTQEIKITNAEPILVKMIVEVRVLKNIEVYSTGYDNVSAERATGSYSQPNKKMFEDRVSTDVVSKLEGITSGVLFNSPGIVGNNTTTPKISIRGRSTIFANDDPLIVVDNFPYDGDINNINPNDVESVTVLKDAAAASIWGVRAGNGVIVITTKKGRMNQPLKISLNSNITVSQKPNLKYDPNFLNSSDFIDVEKILFNNGFYDANISTGYAAITPVVDILNQERNGTITLAEATSQINALRNLDVRNDLSKYFYRNAVNQQYALNFTGGSDKDAYYFSVGYDNNQQMQKGNNFDRVTLNAQNTFKPFSRLDISAGIVFTQTKTNINNALNQFTGAFNGTIYPYATVADANGNALPVVSGYSNSYKQSTKANGFLDWQYYPLQELQSNDNITTDINNDIRANAGMKLNIFKGLNAELKYQYEKGTTNGKQLETQQSYSARNLINIFSIVNPSGVVTGYNLPIGGILNQTTLDLSSYNIRAQLDYLNTWGRNLISVLAGVESRETTINTGSYSLYGYNDDNASYSSVDNLTTFQTNPTGGFSRIPSNLSVSKTTDRFRSYFGNASYTFNEKYTLYLSGRIDGSNYFGVNTNQKNVPLWSTGLKWDINKEDFYHLQWLPYLNIRASYGYNGNLDKTLTAITTFSYLRGLTAPNTNAVQAVVSNFGNPDLRWEKQAITNIGIDFGLNKNVIVGTFEFYFKKGIDLIGDAYEPPSSGITQIRGNYANMKGKGIDLKLTSKNIDRELKWETSLLLSWSTDKVTKYDVQAYPSQLLDASTNITPYVGKPLFGVYSFKWAGLDPATGDPIGVDSTGKTSKDYASLIVPTNINQLVYSGPARPVIFGGINNRFSYKEFSFAFNISYKIGYYFRRTSISYFSLYNSYLGNKDFAIRWIKPGDEKKTNVPSMIYPADPNRDLFYDQSQILVEKGDNVRLQDITISYDFTKQKWKKLPLNHVQIYFYCNNLGIIWRANKDKIDPDYPNGGIPYMKNYSFGIKTNF